MADVQIQPGGAITFQNADPAGDEFENDGATTIYASGPPTGWSIIFASGRDCDFGVKHPYQIDVPVGSTSVITDRFDPFRFNDASGRVKITYLPDAVGKQLAAVSQPVRLKDDPV